MRGMYAFMRFIHISDIHLGKTPDDNYKWGDIRKEELFKNFERIIDVCNQEEIDLLLIAGDLFDAKPSEEEILRVKDDFSRLVTTQVILFNCNDDIDADYDWGEKVNILSKESIEPIIFESMNLELYGSNNVKESEENNKRILLAYEDDFKDDNLNFDYVALGGKHNFEEISKNIVYCGSLETLDSKEIGVHGYIKGEINENDTTYELVPFSIRNYYNETIQVDINLTDSSLIAYMETVINEHGRDNIFIFNIEGLRNPCIKFSFESLLFEYNIIAIYDNSIPHYDFDAIYDLNKDNIIGKYIQRIKDMDIDNEIREKALYLGVESLISR